MKSNRKPLFVIAASTIILSNLTILGNIAPASAYLLNFGGGDKLPVVEFPVNGNNLSFVIDTSLDYSVLNDTAGKIAGLSDTGEIADLGNNNQSFIANKATGGTFILGSKTVPLTFFVTDLPFLPSGVSGVLGTDFFTASGSDISLKSSSLTINPTFSIIRVGNQKIPTVTLPVTGTKGTESVTFLVDTGAGITSISSNDSKKIGLTNTGETVNLGGAASGKSPIKSGQLNAIGSQEFTVTDSIRLPKGISGVLGRNVIANVDLKQNKVTIEDLSGSGATTTTDINFVTTEPVPEPLTMLGSMAALGYGVLLKRKYSKNTES
jgi:gag-polyprotein putative aspartyl protease